MPRLALKTKYQSPFSSPFYFTIIIIINILVIEIKFVLGVHLSLVSFSWALCGDLREARVGWNQL